MRNHAEKQRDMARSVLPSTARMGARFARRHSHKTARQSIRGTLDKVLAAEHPDDIEAPLDRYRIDQGRTASGYFDEWLLGARRSADKVGPLVRWADAIIERTPDLRDGDYWVRRNHFKAILPDTLQGRHALSHLEDLFGHRGDSHWDFADLDTRRAEGRRVAAEAFHARRSKLDAVLSGAGARRLNDRIAALTPETTRVERHVLGPGGWTSERVSVPVVPWLYDGEPERWLGKPYSRHGWAVEPLARNGEAILAHQALDEVHAEMFPTTA